MIHVLALLEVAPRVIWTVELKVNGSFIFEFTLALWTLKSKLFFVLELLVLRLEPVAKVLDVQIIQTLLVKAPEIHVPPLLLLVLFLSVRSDAPIVELVQGFPGVVYLDVKLFSYDVL